MRLNNTFFNLFLKYFLSNWFVGVYAWGFLRVCVFFVAILGDPIGFSGILGLDWVYRHLDGTRIIRICQGKNTDDH
jgi:hypothetical protein